MQRHQQFQQFLENLIALKDHYQDLIAEYEKKAAHAREQLTHINALLADQFVLEQGGQLVSIQAAALEQKQPALFGTAPKNEELQQTPPIESADTPEEAEQILSPLLGVAQQNEAPDAPKASTSVEDSTQSKFLPATKTPLLPKYQHLNKIQAVEKLLRENQGSILHVDYIIRYLYGELDEDAIKAEKPRMYDTLSQGTAKGVWDKVPEQASCYTIDLKLVEPSVSKKTNPQSMAGWRQKRQSGGKRGDEMLPAYQHLNFTAAVESVVRENPGEIITTDKVARELYGELEGIALTKAKDKIGKTLWGGHKNGRWQRVQGQLGCYTLDLKLLK